MGADSNAQIAASAILINSVIYRISQTNPLYQINEYEIQAPTSLISHPFRRGRQGRHTLNLACSWLWCWRHPFLCSRSASKKSRRLNRHLEVARKTQTAPAPLSSVPPTVLPQQLSPSWYFPSCSALFFQFRLERPWPLFFAAHFCFHFFAVMRERAVCKKIQQRRRVGQLCQDLPCRHFLQLMFIFVFIIIIFTKISNNGGRFWQIEQFIINTVIITCFSTNVHLIFLGKNGYLIRPATPNQLLWEVPV